MGNGGCSPVPPPPPKSPINWRSASASCKRPRARLTRSAPAITLPADAAAKAFATRVLEARLKQ